jgi:uncharacterized protein (DUF305 family)
MGGRRASGLMRRHQLGFAQCFAAVLVGAFACGVPTDHVAIAMPASAHAASSPANEPFRAAMHAAMRTMDESMNIACTNDPDRDFAAMMIPHHQGAVDMALIELSYGRDERLRRLAQGIIVEQRSEIALMQQILAAREAPGNGASPSASSHEPAGAIGALP